MPNLFKRDALLHSILMNADFSKNMDSKSSSAACHRSESEENRLLVQLENKSLSISTSIMNARREFIKQCFLSISLNPSDNVYQIGALWNFNADTLRLLQMSAFFELGHYQAIEIMIPLVILLA